ncbi:MAG: ABC transporter ATP-binding protein [Rhodobiaceae bacterium]|nr:ABC transporter ATP-binding protein [Rhodobiaceae bacterium]MCC0052273.1 ABC transporter ATP-binding protein [Rhodobiaceae bacterium]MCC0059740.1 ABC transporter ATP-binding protein [Rhodobiaceae bacterium]
MVTKGTAAKKAAPRKTAAKAAPRKAAAASARSKAKSEASSGQPGKVGPVRRTFAPWNDPAAKPFILYENITKRFGDFVAVDDLTLGIYEREFFSLLGPSGCGKTTLLRMLAGFETPTEGRILLDGQDISTVPPYRRPVNMMFQSYALFPHMSVADNIAFGLKQDKMPKGEIADRVDEMLKLVKLEPFKTRKPHQLSGGQRQRVALARSIAKRPKVLLLDEPLGALDKKLREQTQFELTDLQQQLGLTFLIVTHDQEEAMTVSDRIAVMNQGNIIQVSTPAEMYEYPNSRYVADFIGDINLIEGTIASVSRGKVTVETADAGKLVVNQDLKADKGQKAWIAIRPEKVRIALKKPAARTDNVMSGEVWDIGYLGDVSTYHVKLPAGSTVKALQTNATRLIERPITWEDQAWLSFSPDGAVVLLS